MTSVNDYLLTIEAFDIQCQVRTLKKAYKGFIFRSDGSFDDLRIAAAQKLNLFPGTLQFIYCFGANGKPANIKDGTQLCAPEDFTFFIGDLRSRVVPRKLASGKAHAQGFKQATVYLTVMDESDENEDGASSGAKVQSGKKVRFQQITHDTIPWIDSTNLIRQRSLCRKLHHLRLAIQVPNFMRN